MPNSALLWQVMLAGLTIVAVRQTKADPKPGADCDPTKDKEATTEATVEGLKIKLTIWCFKAAKPNVWKVDHCGYPADPNVKDWPFDKKRRISPAKSVYVYVLCNLRAMPTKADPPIIGEECDEGEDYETEPGTPIKLQDGVEVDARYGCKKVPGTENLFKWQFIACWQQGYPGEAKPAGTEMPFSHNLNKIVKVKCDSLKGPGIIGKEDKAKPKVFPIGYKYVKPLQD